MSNTGKRSRSFIPDFNSVREADVDKSKSEKITSQFLDDEFQFCVKLNLHVGNLKNYDLINREDFEKITHEVRSYIRDEFLPNLVESKNDPDQVIQCFNKHRKLFQLYKTYYVYALRTESFKANIESYEFKELTNSNRLQYYINFLSDLTEFCTSDVRFDIVELIKFISHIKKEIIISHTLFVILVKKIYHLEDCSKFIMQVNAAVISQPKYRKKAPLLIGKINEIHKEEVLLYQELKTYVLNRLDPTGFIKCVFNHEILFELYEQDAELRSETTLVKAFCLENKIQEDVFQVVTNHLLSLQKLFQLLKETCDKFYEKCERIDGVIALIQGTLKRVDLWIAVGEIVGSKINLQEQGRILVRDKFCVEYENEDPFTSVVFLFEKAIVFTEEQKLIPKFSGYSYYSHILLSKMVFYRMGDEEFQVYFQDRYIKTDNHFVKHTEDYHGNVGIWTKYIADSLLNQVKDVKVGKNIQTTEL